MQPFESLTVVSLEQAVAAPLATRHLADLGARVIKIERPGQGDFARAYDATVHGLSSYFVWLNRSKESLTLDLARPGGREIFDRLIARADVFVQNVGPGVATKLGTDPAALAARDPRLIVCTISGYGASGPYAGRKAYDLLVQSEVGLLSITGSPDAPAKTGISVADIAAGMYAYSGILAALAAREHHGRGAVLTTSLFDALGEWMSAPAAYTEYGGSAPTASGAAHASIAPYGPFGTRDGDRVFLAVQNAREWTRLCRDVLRRPSLEADPRFASNPARVANRPALDAEIETVTSSLAAAELVARLEAADIGHAQLNTMADFQQHAQLQARGRWQSVETPAGPVRALRPPLEIEGHQPRMDPVPALGQQTDAILAELGFGSDRISTWREEGTI